MITPKEYVEYPTRPPKVAWIHGLKLLSHILEGDTRKSYYKCPHVQKSFLTSLATELRKPTPPEGLTAIFERTLRRKPRTQERRDYMGCEIDVEGYLNKSEKCFVDYRKEDRPRTSLTIVIDINTPHCDRDLDYMEKRHKLVYQLCASAVNMNQAIRIIAAFGVNYPEASGSDLFLIVVKDYLDPIFENIWGALKNNRTTNDLLNCIMDYLVGTESAGNGHPKGFTLDKFIHDQLVLVDPVYHTLDNKHNKIVRTRT